MKLLLLDRDGTITQNRLRPGDYINHPDEIELIPRVLERLQEYADAGWTIALISNQGGIEKGFLTVEQCVEGFQKTMALAPMISLAMFCPFAHPKSGVGAIAVTKNGPYTCTSFEEYGYRKPNPGMILSVISLVVDEYSNNPLILDELGWEGEEEIEECLYVGDRPEDEQVAQAALSVCGGIDIAFQWADEWLKSEAAIDG